MRKTTVTEIKRGALLGIAPFALALIFIANDLRNVLPVFNWIRTFAYILLCLYIIWVIYIIKKHGGTYNLFLKNNIINWLDDSLESVGAYVPLSDDIVKTPSIHVDTINRSIIINLENLYIRKKVEAYFDVLSTALPRNLSVEKAWIDKSQNNLIIEYQDLSKDTRIIYRTVDDFVERTTKTLKTELILDRYHYFELKKLNGLLIVGSSGSGKTYLLQQLILQALIKKWDVSIIDYKRTYQMFEDVCNVAYKVEDIIHTLEQAIDELHKRQEYMDYYLRSNPNALAVDCGYDVKFIVIEEYLALVNSGIDKKTLDKIEKMLLELVTTGRQMNITLCMCMQVSSSQTLNTSIRANLPVKICMGNANRTILETLFGIGNVPKIPTKMDIGEGLATYDYDIFPIKVPSILFDYTELIAYIQNTKEDSTSD